MIKVDRVYAKVRNKCQNCLHLFVVSKFFITVMFLPDIIKNFECSCKGQDIFH